MPTEWRLWVDRTPRVGWANMAIDQTLLERASAGERWLRLYGWAPSCLSFGRHEPAAARYDAARIASLGMDVVRRPTGGRAVWHAREVTYTVACPGGLGSLRESYREIHSMLRDALRSLGVAAELASPRPPVAVDAGACFAAAAGGEIMVRGKKVVGSAQLREGDALLQHGSILLADCQDRVDAVTRGAGPAPENSPAYRPLLDPCLDENDLIDAVTLTAARRWRGEWVSEDLPDVVDASSRHAPRFRSEEWTWGSGR
jgi:lipoyl(octanoyl) transferase